MVEQVENGISKPSIPGMAEETEVLVLPFDLNGMEPRDGISYWKRIPRVEESRLGISPYVSQLPLVVRISQGRVTPTLGKTPRVVGCREILPEVFNRHVED